jgi:N-acetylneuraminate synthase/N,N'-diacetyllegionaminate synthase
MRIGQREIGPASPPYVIAELGVNHDGSLEKALALTQAAARAGADAIKLQLFEAERLMSRASRLAEYQAAAGEKDPVEMLRRLELPLDAMGKVVACAHDEKLHAIVTVFSLELVEPSRLIAWDAYKAASPDIINRPLLEAMAGMSEVGSRKSEVGQERPGGVPLIISTGASTLQEVARALSWLHPIRERLAVLQCVSSYPTTSAQAELGGIAAIADIFPGAVGYSDHTRETLTAALAAALGAQILEKHLTLDKSAPGPDHAASLTSVEMKEYVTYARNAYKHKEHLREVHTASDFQRFIGAAEKISSPGVVFERVKRVLPVEEDVRKVSRQSLTTTRRLEAGHRITREDLTVKRPGTGVAPFRLGEVVGRCVKRTVEADVPLADQDIE